MGETGAIFSLKGKGNTEKEGLLCMRICDNIVEIAAALWEPTICKYAKYGKQMQAWSPFSWSFPSVVYITGTDSHGKVMYTERVRPLQPYLAPLFSWFFPFSHSGIFSVLLSPQHLLLPSGFHTYCLGLECSIFVWLALFQLSWDAPFPGEASLTPDWVRSFCYMFYYFLL